MSAETHARVAHLVVARAVEEIVVKGRTQPVMTYELVGLREASAS